MLTHICSKHFMSTDMRAVVVCNHGSCLLQSSDGWEQWHESDRLNRLVRITASWCTQASTTTTGMLLGLAALLGFTALSLLLTSCSWRERRSVPGRAEVGGRRCQGGAPLLLLGCCWGALSEGWRLRDRVLTLLLISKATSAKQLRASCDLSFLS